jgi:branched-chain amino acid transport system ATP-binding protein
MTLSIEGIQVAYGKLEAVRGVSLSVSIGEIVALVGPNGAGKSTTLLAATGVLRLRAGVIRLDGRLLHGLRPEDIVRRGLALVPEGRDIFRSLTVAENLLVAHRGDAANLQLETLLGLFPILAERYRKPAGQLSGGEQQQLAIARSLLTNPRFLMVDEPSLGLAPMMIDRVYQALQALRKERELGILVVEQSMRRVFEVADRICVMREGTVVAEANRDKFGDHATLERAYFGATNANSHRGHG